MQRHKSNKNAELNIREALKNLDSERIKLIQILKNLTRRKYLERWIGDTFTSSDVEGIQIKEYFLNFADPEEFFVTFALVEEKNSIYSRSVTTRWLLSKYGLTYFVLEGSEWYKQSDGKTSEEKLKDLIPNPTIVGLKKKFKSINKNEYNEEFLFGLISYLHVDYFDNDHIWEMEDDFFSSQEYI